MKKMISILAILILWILWNCNVPSSDGSSKSFTAPPNVDCDTAIEYIIDGDTMNSIGWDGRITNISTCPWWQIVEWDCAFYNGPDCEDVTLSFQNDCDGTGWYLSGDSVDPPTCE